MQDSPRSPRELLVGAALLLALASQLATSAHAQQQLTRPSAPAATPPAAQQTLAPTRREARNFVEIFSRWTKTRPADAPAPETVEDRRLEQLGRLVHSEVTCTFEEVRLVDALRAMRRELKLNMMVFTADPTGRSSVPGIDGELLVDLEFRKVKGLALLEALCAVAGADCTWQIHNGVIEVGPRRYLARQEARETRLYDTTDLAIDPPDWEASAAGSRTIQHRNSDEVIGELARMIATHCEPEAFLPETDTRIDEATGKVVPRQHTTPSGSGAGRGGTGRKSPNTQASANYDPEQAQVFVTGRWASIQVKDNRLAILAPDFVHRAIDGYGAPIPPPASE
jgi:hypothetical protein